MYDSQSVSLYFYPHVWALHRLSSIQTFGDFPSTVKEQSILHFLHLATVGSSQICLILSNGYLGNGTCKQAAEKSLWLHRKPVNTNTNTKGIFVFTYSD